jgi:membrane protein YqaA with SNARE-associated domain
MLLDVHSLTHAAARAIATLIQAAHAPAAASAAHAQSTTFSHRLWRWLRHLGGPGLIILALVDNSVIPLTGSMDALTIVLAAHPASLWPYYAAMATAGAVLGGYLTYRLGQKGGEDALKRRVPPKKLQWVKKVFAQWGFGSLVIAVILPPPMPVVPFLLAAGATKYSTKKFLAALTLGRAIRYSALAYLGTIYGRQIIALLRQHGYKILITYVAIVAVVAAIILVKRRSAKSSKPRKGATPATARAG